MSSEFMKSNPALDALIAECTDPETIRELTKAHLQEAGLISRDRGEGWGARVLRHPEPESDVSLPANGFKFEKTVKFHPASGKRPLVIRANTLEDLQELENQIVGQ